MRLTKHKRKTMAAMNMTPMIDIVFLLIIFFMTVTQVSEINKKRVQLPKLKGSEDQQPSTVIINVDESGTIEIAGRSRTVLETMSLVGNELANVGNEPLNLTIVIRADRRGSSRTVNELVRSLSKLGIKQIRYTVQSEG